MQTVVVFDFDGTIAETMALAMEVLDQLSDKFGFRKVSTRDVWVLRNEGKWEEVFKSLEIPLAKLPAIIREGRSGLAKRIDSAAPVKGIKEVLLQLKMGGYGLGLLTSNSKETAEKFLRNNGLDFFDFIYSDSSLWGKDKVLEKLLEDRKLGSEQVVYVGDEIRDIDAASKAGVKVIAVSWGYNTRKILKEQNPDYLVESPKELVEVLELIIG